MKISEIIQLEKENSGKIYLLKEGLFWRAYEVSAYIFVSNIKSYGLTKKYYKNIGKEVVFIGFPESILTGILNSANKYKTNRLKMYLNN